MAPLTCSVRYLGQYSDETLATRLFVGCTLRAVALCGERVAFGL